MLAYLAAAGVFALGIGLVLHIRKAAPRAVGVCGLLVGFAIAGVAGSVLQQLGGAIGNASDTLGGQLFGVALSGSLAAGALTWLYLDLRKKGKVTKALPYLAVVTPPLVIPVFLGALAAVPALSPVASGVSAVYSSLGG